MRICALNHLVGAVVEARHSRRVLVLGSSSVLGYFPELGETGGILVTTFDADLLLDPIDESDARFLGKLFGENTAFHKEFGYHADIVHPDITRTFPPGWEGRLAPLPGFGNVFCLDPHDLAAVKVSVGRDKDLALVRVLLELGKLDPDTVRLRFQSLDLGERELFRAGRNLAAVLRSAG